MKYLTRAAAILFWLLVWEGAALAVGKELLLPAPPAVLCRLGELALTAPFWRAVGASLGRVLCGIAAALLGGTVLAALCFRLPLLDALLRPLLTVVKSTPVASFIILALLWMGRDLLPAFISALVVLPAVFSNVSAGIRAIDPELAEVAWLFRFSRGRTLTVLYVPSVLPWFLSACRSALGMGWKAGIAAEVLTVPAVSIGKMLYESKLYWETLDLFAWTAAVVLCSLLIEGLVLAAAGGLESRFRRGEEAAP
ncbi:MAG: ABC transporter permease subunit [Oscillospiraceae bacterium]|nr:ABC transporter permease subunit [Oscillospiraceae bacterium]